MRAWRRRWHLVSATLYIIIVYRGNLNKLSQNFVGALRTTTTNCRIDTAVANGRDLYMQEEVEEHKDAIWVLKDENGRLYKILGERDEEMRILRKARDEEKRDLAGTGVAADTAAGRIMELSMKNRELTADLESERNKVRQLTKKARDMERELISSGNVQGNPKQAVAEQKSKSDADKDSSEVTALQDKLSQSNNKLAEFRNQCEKLKKDLKVAHKILLKHERKFKS